MNHRQPASLCFSPPSLFFSSNRHKNYNTTENIHSIMNIALFVYSCASLCLSDCQNGKIKIKWNLMFASAQFWLIDKTGNSILYYFVHTSYLPKNLNIRRIDCYLILFIAKNHIYIYIRPKYWKGQAEPKKKKKPGRIFVTQIRFGSSFFSQVYASAFSFNLVNGVVANDK